MQDALQLLRGTADTLTCAAITSYAQQYAEGKFTSNRLTDRSLSLHNTNYMTYKPMISLCIFLFAFAVSAFAQQDSVQNLLFVPKGKAISFGKNDYQPGKQAFYIYRNCMYYFVLSRGVQIPAKVLDIRNDSVYFTTRINETDAGRSIAHMDTLSLHPSQIKKIRMNTDRIMGLSKSFHLTEHSYVLEKSTAPKVLERVTKTVYSTDSSNFTVYELFPYLSSHGIAYVYEKCGITYHYENIEALKAQRCDTIRTQQAVAPPKKRAPQVKNWVWVTPSKATKINGLNLGVVTDDFTEFPLTINGVNLNADIPAALLGMYGLMYVGIGNKLKGLPDTIDVSRLKGDIAGLSISAGGVIGDFHLKGVSINGIICTAVKSHGLLITGSQNGVSEFMGVEICALRNVAAKGRGVQIGLLNICKNFKGVQIGLWNVNSKRKLPLINWNF